MIQGEFFRCYFGTFIQSQFTLELCPRTKRQISNGCWWTHWLLLGLNWWPFCSQAEAKDAVSPDLQTPLLGVLFTCQVSREKGCRQKHKVSPPQGKQRVQLRSSSVLNKRAETVSEFWDLLVAPQEIFPNDSPLFIQQSFAEQTRSPLCITRLIKFHSITPGSRSVKPQSSTVDRWAAPLAHLWVEYFAQGYFWQSVLREGWIMLFRFLYPEFSRQTGDLNRWNLADTSLCVCVSRLQ